MFLKGRLAAVPLMVLILSLATACSLLNSPPVASFTLTAGSWRSPAIVSCDASACTDPDGIVVKYEWTFGDGSTGSRESTSHTYTSSGEYTVVLQVTDDEGKTAAVSETVTVLPPYVYEPSPPLPTPPAYPEPLPASSGSVRYEGYDSPQSSPLPLPGETGMAFFMEYVGSSKVGDGYKFSVVLIDALHQRVAQLADEYGNFEGRKDYNGGGGHQGPFFLDIVACGYWAITVVEQASAESPPQTYTGCCAGLLSQYSPLFTLDPGRAAFYFDEVDVVLLDYSRNTETPLSREVDVLGGTYLLKIRGGGCWEVSVEQ